MNPKELKKLPKPLKYEIEKAFEAEKKKLRFRILYKTLEYTMKSDTLKSMGEEYEHKFSRIAKKNLAHIVFGMNESGVTAYALIKVPPPTHQTRIVTRLWCSDPFVKERIIKKIEKYESI